MSTLDAWRELREQERACGLCGKDPAEGWAKIGDVRYCHGDYDPDPTCYMRAQVLMIPNAYTSANSNEWRVAFLLDGEK